MKIELIVNGLDDLAFAELTAFRLRWLELTAHENRNLDPTSNGLTSDFQEFIINVTCGYTDLVDTDATLVIETDKFVQLEFEAIVRARGRSLAEYFHSAESSNMIGTKNG